MQMEGTMHGQDNLEKRKNASVNVRVLVAPLHAHGLSGSEKLTILRGQLTLIRARAELGIPVSVESLARAERIARELELDEVAA
jgi:hypothetical protein